MNGGTLGNLQTTQKKSCFVRAFFEYDPSKDSGIPGKGIAFKFGDILHVLNASDDDWWQALKLVGNNHKQGIGIIPSKLRIEKKERSRMRSVKFQGHHTESSATLLKDKKKKLAFFTRKLNRSKLKSRSESTLVEPKPAPNPVDNINILSYESVAKVELTYTRPIIILGPFKDVLCDHLIAQQPDQFETCVPHTTRPPKDDEIDGSDYHFVKDKMQMQRDAQRGEFVETGEYNGNLYGTSLQAVKDVAKRGKHCLLDVSGNAIARLRQAGLHPISIFTKPRTIDAIYECNKRMTTEQARQAFEKASKQENEFYQLFTAIIQVDTLEDSLAKVKQVLVQHTSTPCAWVPSKQPL